MELALTGDPITAERGFELGLVNRLAEPGEAVDTALELAEAIAANGPLALAASKRILIESVDWPEAEFFDRQGEISGPVMTSEDAREGATAFAEKRAPVWKGASRRSPGPRRSRSASAGRRGRGARTGRSPARCRAPGGRAAIGSVSDGPSSAALMCAGMSSSPSSVCVQYGAPLRDRLVEPRLEVAADVGRRVLVERQRGGRVADQQVQQADLELARARAARSSTSRVTR